MALYDGSIRITKVCITNLFTDRFGSCVRSFGKVLDALVRIFFYIQTAFSANHEF